MTVRLSPSHVVTPVVWFSWPAPSARPAWPAHAPNDAAATAGRRRSRTIGPGARGSARRPLAQPGAALIWSRLFTWKLSATEVARMAGHANYRITLDMYAGILDRARQATR
jgi:hypothetical protein